MPYIYIYIYLASEMWECSPFLEDRILRTQLKLNVIQNIKCRWIIKNKTQYKWLLCSILYLVQFFCLTCWHELSAFISGAFSAYIKWPMTNETVSISVYENRKAISITIVLTHRWLYSIVSYLSTMKTLQSLPYRAIIN